jgi:hypothetical protein
LADLSNLDDEGTSAMCAEETIIVHSELGATNTAACAAALKAGVFEADAVAVLTRISELFEGAK